MTTIYSHTKFLFLTFFTSSQYEICPFCGKIGVEPDQNAVSALGQYGSVNFNIHHTSTIEEQSDQGCSTVS